MPSTDGVVGSASTVEDMNQITEPGKGHSRYRECRWTTEDERAFSYILKEAFPGLIICTVDTDNEKLNYYDTIADSREYKYPIVYLPEPGWKPKFVVKDPKYFPDMKCLDNGPGRHVSILRSRLIERDLRNAKPGSVGDMEPPNRRVTYLDNSGYIQSYYHDGRPEEKAFVAKVFRLMTDYMTNSFEVVDLKTDEVIAVEHGTILWSGRDVVHRCREEKDFFLFAGFREYYGNRWIGANAIPRPSKNRRRSAKKSGNG